MLRFIRGFMIALAIIVAQIVRLRIEALYPTTLIVRTELLAIIIWLYAETQDPLFLTLIGIVGLGVVLTTFSLLADRNAAKGTSAQAR